REIATGRGFFVFRGLDRDRYCDNELGLIFRGFGDIRDISDILVERSKRRGYQSGGFQTAHTDPSGEVGIVAMLSLKMAIGRRKPDRQRPHRAQHAARLVPRSARGILPGPRSAPSGGRRRAHGPAAPDRQRPVLRLRKRLAQLRLPTWLYAPRRGARR